MMDGRSVEEKRRRTKEEKRCQFRQSHEMTDSWAFLPHTFESQVKCQVDFEEIVFIWTSDLQTLNILFIMR